MRLSRSRAASGRQGDDRLPPSCNARPFELFEDGLAESAVIQDRLRANYDLQASARPPRRRERRRNRRGGTPYAGLKSEAASHGQGVCGDVLAERMRAAIASVILIVSCSRRSNIQQSDLNCSMGPHFGLPGFGFQRRPRSPRAEMHKHSIDAVSSRRSCSAASRACA